MIDIVHEIKVVQMPIDAKTTYTLKGGDRPKTKPPTPKRSLFKTNKTIKK